jgi:hypothetical protein
LACSGFYKFRLLRGLPGSLFPLCLYQTACFGARPSSFISTCSCLRLLILSLIENTPNYFLLSSFLILSTLVHLFTDLKNRVSAACNFCVSLFIIVQHSLPYSSVGTAITWYNFICISFRVKKMIWHLPGNEPQSFSPRPIIILTELTCLVPSLHYYYYLFLSSCADSVTGSCRC